MVAFWLLGGCYGVARWFLYGCYVVARLLLCGWYVVFIIDAMVFILVVWYFYWCHGIYIGAMVFILVP